MKIKNDLVSIKIGNKQYDFNNLILDEYLKRFVKTQLNMENVEEISLKKTLKYCFLKFDTPLSFTETSEIKNNEFNITFLDTCNINQTISKNQITTEYTYNTDEFIFDYEKGTSTDVSISDYYNRKITAIGFNSWWLPEANVCAILDLSNHNIYLQENQDISITRKDIVTTDAIFYSNNENKIQGPVHLLADGMPELIEQPDIYRPTGGYSSFNDNGYGILYSVGLSSYTDYIDKEFIIGEDIQVEDNGTELNINGLENYLSTDSPLFCSEDLYCNSNLYPVKTNYKYVIFKYKVWQKVHSGTYEEIIETLTDTGYYYYQAIPIGKFGKSNLKIKYERG